MEIIYQGKTIVELAKMSLERPSDFGWWGGEDMFVTWGWAGIDMHRDSSILEISNFQVITKDLMEKFPDDFNIVGLGHWAVGHVDRLTVKVIKSASNDIDEDNITEAFREAIDWLVSLDDYPIADESHYADLEYEETLEYIKYDVPKFVLQSEGFESKILEWFAENGVDVMIDAQVYPSDEDLVRAAYWNGLIDEEYKEEWGDACIAYGLPAIDWENGIYPAKYDGQMSIFDISS